MFTSSAAVFNLLLWVLLLTGKVSVTIRKTSVRVPAVGLRVAEALSMLTLQYGLWSHICLH